MVFYHHEVAPSPRGSAEVSRPGLLRRAARVPFTFSSNLLHALHAAVKRVRWDERFAGLVELSAWLRTRLRELGFELDRRRRQRFARRRNDRAARPTWTRRRIGGLIQESGYLLSYNSDYLRRKNWIQVCLMGECAKEKIVSLAQRA